METITKKKKAVRINTRIRKTHLNDLYRRYRNLSHLWDQYANLVSRAGDSDSCLNKSKQEKAWAKSAVYMHSAIEMKERELEKEEKRLEEAGE